MNTRGLGRMLSDESYLGHDGIGIPFSAIADSAYRLFAIPYSSCLSKPLLMCDYNLCLPYPSESVYYELMNYAKNFTNLKPEWRTT